MRPGRWLVLLIGIVLLGACGGGDAGDGLLGTSVTSAAGSMGDAATTMPGDGVDGTGGLGRSEIVVPAAESMVETDRWGLVSEGYIAVLLDDGRDRADAESLASDLGGSVIGEIELIDLYQVSIPPAGEAGLVAAIDVALAHAGVDFAFPGVPVTPFEEIWGVRTSPTNDPAYAGDNGRGYAVTGVEKALEYVRGSGIPLSGVKVGVPDTGIVPTVGELTGPVHVSGQAARVVTITYSDGSTGQVPESHGTEIASLVGANPDDGGIIAPASILGDQLEIEAPDVVSGDSMTSLDALKKLVDERDSDVVNISWGGESTGQDPGTAEAYRRFFERISREKPGVVFVCAAGNDGQAKNPDGSPYTPDVSRSWPCGHDLPNVITVGNVLNDGTNDPTSNLGNPDYEVTLAAPGTQSVRVDANGAIVNTYGGTSHAAPQVTSTVALMKSLDPTLTAEQIKQILTSAARQSVDTPDGSFNIVDPAMGAGILAVDVAVLDVVNRVRERAGQPALVPEQLEALGVLDALATSGEPGDFLVQGFVAACQADCTTVSIHTANASFDGSAEQQLSGPGEVSWTVHVDQYPATVFVQRWDNGAGSRITIEQTEIAGTWVGTLWVTEILVPEGQTAPDGSSIEPRWYTFEEVLVCADEMGAAIDEAVKGALDQLREGTPISLTFTGTLEEPGSVTVDTADEGTGSVPWRVEGGSIVIEFVDAETYASLSMTVTGTTMSGAFGSIQPDGLEMRGAVSLTRVG